MSERATAYQEVPTAPAFTHHREAGWSVIACVIVLLLVVEGGIVHAWLSHAGHPIAMWVALGVHLCGLVWVVVDALALRTNRTVLVPGRDGKEPVLEVRVGIRAHALFPLSSITEVTRGNWETAGPDERLVSVSGTANVKIAFEPDVEFRTMLGARTRITSLFLQVDDAERFQRAVADYLARA